IVDVAQLLQHRQAGVRFGCIAVDQSSFGPGPAQLRHNADPLPGLDRPGKFGRLPVGEAARAPDLRFEQGNPDLYRPRESFFEDLSWDLLSVVTCQADTPLRGLEPI